ncbi:hypothetical protein [Streptomyces platensis]|uniref:hypothetical protein n=1 Tax=Streptomyces platensis TaxID=58346 RepID=UPI00331BC228
MSDDGLDELEREAQDRKRRKGREAGTSRNPRQRPKVEEERQRRAAEAKKREEERQERRRREAEQLSDPEPPPVGPEPDGQDEGEGESDAPPKRRTRPASTPFYPDPDNEAFLWAIQSEAVKHREKIPATAVIRLALRRLQDQKTPAEIVQELGGPVQTKGKMGRPRR